ncbi:MAG TPA: hypothetical protein PLV92_27055, partial [Pirellulaceae bacterium]|nr:hypothetical protein [Pirellulaceae bacterium]
YVHANNRVEVIGGVNPTGTGVFVSGASEIYAVDPTASMFFDSTGDADIQGAIVAGGTIQHLYDATGAYLGRRQTNSNGDSTIRIEADQQIRIGQDLRAGKSINLVGGLDPVEPGVPYSGNGIVVYGSTQVSTWRPNSQINLNAPGPIMILPASHANEVAADGFIATADGRLANDVTLKVSVNKIDFTAEATILVPKSATTSNTSVDDLLSDVQAAWAAASWKIVTSTNASRPVGSTYVQDPAHLDFGIILRESRFVVTSPYVFSLLKGATNASLLGFNGLTANPIASTARYSIYAPQAGSTITVGAPAGPNGKLYIGGKLLADAGITLYSGVSADGRDIELPATGRLETLHASIVLSPGVDGVLSGEILAGGANSDVVITSGHSLELRGRIEAQRNILIS